MGKVEEEAAEEASDDEWADASEKLLLQLLIDDSTISIKRTYNMPARGD